MQQFFLGEGDLKAFSGKMMYFIGKYLILSVLFFTEQCLHAQDYFRIVNGIPHLPVVASTASVSSPVAGMLVFSTAEAEPMIYSGSDWIKLCTPALWVSAGNSYFTVENGISHLPVKTSESISSPVTGASYYSTNSKTMVVYDGSGWTSVPGLPGAGSLSTQTGTSSYNGGPFCFPVLSDNPATTGLSAGAIYINSSDNCFHVYDGANWSTLSCGFVTRWNITAGNFTFPVYSGGTYNCTINWGDGSSSEVTSATDPDLTHAYSWDGEFLVQITGTFSCMYVNNIYPARDKLLEVVSWGDTGFTSFYKAFYGCSNLTGIPGSPMPGGSSVINFSYCFSNCAALADIPADLFSESSAATGFSHCFDGCAAVTAIPSGLFDKNTAVADFSHCFGGCGAVTAIPSGLFDNNTTVTDFSHCFDGCGAVTAIPSGLFDNNTAVTDFSYCFNDCNALVGAAPELWNRTPEPEGDGCFYNCSGLSNYSGMPDNWKYIIIIP